MGTTAALEHQEKALQLSLFQLKAPFVCMDPDDEMEEFKGSQCAPSLFSLCV